MPSLASAAINQPALRQRRRRDGLDLVWLDDPVDERLPALGWPLHSKASNGGNSRQHEPALLTQQYDVDAFPGLERPALQSWGPSFDGSSFSALECGKN